MDSFRIRTGYSFRHSAGKLGEVLARLASEDVGAVYAPITDRGNTFGFHRWQKMATEAGLKPVLGVELDVSADIHEKRPSSQPWVFMAQDSLQPINRLVTQATTQFRYLATANPGAGNQCRGCDDYGWRIATSRPGQADYRLFGRPLPSPWTIHTRLRGAHGRQAWVELGSHG